MKKMHIVYKMKEVDRTKMVHEVNKLDDMQ